MHADIASPKPPASSRRDLSGAIDSTVARIAHGFADGDRRPTLAELMQVTGDLEEAVLGRRAPSEAIGSRPHRRLPRSADRLSKADR